MNYWLGATDNVTFFETTLESGCESKLRE